MSPSRHLALLATTRRWRLAESPAMDRQGGRTDVVDGGMTSLPARVCGDCWRDHTSCQIGRRGKAAPQPGPPAAPGPPGRRRQDGAFGSSPLWQRRQYRRNAGFPCSHPRAGDHYTSSPRRTPVSAVKRMLRKVGPRQEHLVLHLRRAIPSAVAKTLGASAGRND